MRKVVSTSRGSTLFLKAVIVIIGLAVLALCTLAIPSVLMSDDVGVYRPILLGMYLPAIPFFIALHQALKILNYIDQNKTFSLLTVSSLRISKYCAFAISAMYAAGMPYIYYAAEKDDAPGVILIGFIFTFVPFVIGTAASVFEKLLKNAIEIKSENDLIV